MFSLVLAGCGNMGSALLDGWLKAGLVKQACVAQPGSRNREKYAADPRVRWYPGLSSLPLDTPVDAVILAVKPQILDSVLPACRPFADKGIPVLSVAAGKTLRWLEERLGEKAPVVRAMPNLAATVGLSATVACASAAVTQAQRDLCRRLLEAVGTVHWITDESLMDAVTALSGSGPAWVFLLAETLTQAGTWLGLAPDLAEALARQTIIGAGELLRQSGEPAQALREKVTSPQGTTAAGLQVLMKEEALQTLFDRALEAAAHRAGELSS
ncbi:MAG: pyrroline-5-carboxylate reductase [Pseudomonadota bacterium]|nr:pyrroline-5-carboxylate reductase [Pseudomonadota bacterium]